MNLLVLLNRLKLFALVPLLLVTKAYSQTRGADLYELLHAYESSLSFTEEEFNNDNTESFNLFIDLFLHDSCYVINDITDKGDEQRDYLTISEYTTQIKEQFTGEIAVQLFDLKILNIDFLPNYLLYKVSITKSIIGEKVNGSFFNINIDLQFDVIHYYSGDQEILKIFKISSKNISNNTDIIVNQSLLSNINFYITPGISSLNFNNIDDNFSDEFSGFSAKNDYTVKVGCDVLFILYSSNRMSYYIGTGIGYINYNSTLGLESYNSGYNTYDIDDDYYYKIISGNNFQQIIELSYLEFPLFLKTKFEHNRFSFYLNTGLQIGIATKKYLNTNQGAVNYKGEYSILDDNNVAYNFVLEDVDEYGFGTYKINQIGHEMNMSPVNLSLLLSAGITYPLNKTLSLTMGLDFVPGLSNVTITDNTTELISDNNINSVITSSSSFKTSFIGVKLGLSYKFNKPAKPNLIEAKELQITDYVSPHSFDSTSYSNERINNFALPYDYSGFNLYFLDLSDESINRANVKKILENSLDSVNVYKGNYFVFLSNFNNPIIANPKSDYDSIILRKIYSITPDLPDVKKDVSSLLESLKLQKNIRKVSRVNLFFIMSDSFYRYQSEKLIEELKNHFINSDVQVYLYMENPTGDKVEIKKYNYIIQNINLEE